MFLNGEMVNHFFGNIIGKDLRGLPKYGQLKIRHPYQLYSKIYLPLSD
jgi:hypothetical protein